MAGALFIGEPIALGLLSFLHRAHLLASGQHFLVLNVVSNSWVQGTLATAVLVGELAIGIALVAFGVRIGRRAREQPIE